MAGCLPGLYLVAQDLQTSGEFLDGVGIVFGLLLRVPAVAAGGLAIRALRLLGRAPHHAWRWGLATGMFGVLSVAYLSSLDIYSGAVILVVVIPLLLTVVAWASRPSANTVPADRFGE